MAFPPDAPVTTLTFPRVFFQDTNVSVQRLVFLLIRYLPLLVLPSVELDLFVGTCIPSLVPHLDLLLFSQSDITVIVS